MASAGPYANHLHLIPDRRPWQYLTTQLKQNVAYASNDGE